MTAEELDDLRAKAVVAANRWIESYREVHGLMLPHADFDKMLAETTDRATVMARYVLAVDELRRHHESKAEACSKKVADTHDPQAAIDFLKELTKRNLVEMEAAK